MTPKEKAHELIEKYKNINNVIFTLIKDKPLIWIAKKCALIAIDEMLEEIKDSADKEIVVLRIIYWEKVKQEIEKL